MCLPNESVDYAPHSKDNGWITSAEIYSPRALLSLVHLIIIMGKISRSLILASLLAAIGTALFYYFQYIQLTQSTKPLRVSIEGRALSLEYDEEGVGRIQGETLEDVMYAQGYQHAQ